MFRTTFLLSILAVVNMVVALAYHWYVLAYFGAGRETDSLYAGMMLPQFVMSVMGVALPAVLVPLLSNLEGGEWSEAVSWFSLVVLGGSTGLYLVLLISGNWWVPLLVPGFDKTGTQLAVFLTIIQLPSIVFGGLLEVLRSALQARQSFVQVEVVRLIATFISGVWLICALPIYGITAAAWGVVIRFAANALLLQTCLGRASRPNIKADLRIEAWYRVRPMLIGALYYKTDILVGRALASLAPAGSLSLLDMAERLYSAGDNVLKRSVATPAIPRLSSAFHQGDGADFRKELRRRLLALGGLSGTGYLIVVVGGQDLLELLVRFGEFSSDNVVTLWLIMVILGGKFVSGALGQLVTGSFYSMGLTTVPVKIGVIGYSLYVPLRIASFWAFGLVGLVSMTSVYYVGNFVILSAILTITISKRFKHVASV